MANPFDKEQQPEQLNQAQEQRPRGTGLGRALAQQQLAGAGMENPMSSMVAAGSYPGGVVPGQRESFPQLQTIPQDLQADRQLDSISSSLENMAGGQAQDVKQVMGGQAIGKEELVKAMDLLRKYKSGKTSVERRIIASQQWWKLRNWEQAEKEKDLHGSNLYKSKTAWLWKAIAGAHADCMDSYPEPVILPRMEDDKEQAKMLSDIVPVAMEINDFSDVYSDVSWQMLLEGTGVFGIFWDQSKINGMGDISIQKISTLSLFWQPGITNIQDSRNVFLATLEDQDVLKAQYPEMASMIKAGNKGMLAEYAHDDSIDTTDKALVIEWYYKKNVNGKNLLHYCKFVDDQVLFASENEPEYQERGWYDDGEYPFVFVVPFPMPLTPCGEGFIDICKDTQMDIDLMNQAQVQNAVMTATSRYFIRKDGGINEQEFADWRKPLVHCNGNLSSDALTPVQVKSMPGSSMNMLVAKIDELKEITGNTDVQNGGTPSGVTAASAVVALQEKSGRTAKDINRAFYRSYRKVVLMVIERIRQFYDMGRQFRIRGQRGNMEFATYDNSGIRPQHQGVDFGMDMGYRLPVFDVEVHAEKETGYTKAAQNELALQLYQYGVYNPQNVDQSLMLLDSMEFRGKEELQQKLSQMGTMQQMLAQYQKIALSLAQQHDPALAEQIANQIMGGQAAPVAMGGGNAGTPGSTNDDKSDNAYTRNARERVQEATRI